MDFLILALATWRLTSLLTYEDGPLDVFVRLRDMLGIYYNEHSQRTANNALGRLVACLWCLSVWTGAAWAVLFYFLPDWVTWIALPFTLSAGAVLVDGMVERNG